MIAEEPFSDRPQAVCPVIGAVLREYNDLLDDQRRQDLYGCAATVLGTRASDGAALERMDHCLRVVEELEPERRHSLRWRLASRPARRFQELRERAPKGSVHIDDFGRQVARYLFAGRARGHERLLELVDELAAVGRRVPEPSVQQRLDGDQAAADQADRHGLGSGAGSP